jgi:hypothetical protein
MKRFISVFLAALMVVNVACVHAQTTQSTASSIPSELETWADAPSSPTDAFTVDLPPLPEAQPLPQLATDGGVGPNGEAITPLSLNQRAPFNGVLFNGPALAYIEVEYRTVQQRCMIDRRRETEEVVARYQAQLERLQVSLDATNAQHHIIIQGRDREIASLNRIVDQQRNAMTISPLQTILYIGGGVLGGALIAGVTAYIVTRP